MLASSCSRAEIGTSIYLVCSMCDAEMSEQDWSLDTAPGVVRLSDSH